MTFPDTALDLLTEMQIGVDWTDISADVHTRTAVTLERGSRDEASGVDPSTATLELNNRAYRYSPSNPRSPNYRLIGRNTPIRFSVAGPEPYMATTGVSGDIVATPDHASLDIVGDIDVRVELTADWERGIQQTMIGKWSTTDGNRSWIWRLLNGQSLFVWSPTGLSAAAVTATIDLPRLPRRAALRATLDVDNGSSGWTVTLYWAETLDGPWNLVATTTGTGVTSIFSGTAPLEIAPTQITASQTRLPWRGRLHRAEVRSSIGGAVVASPDVRALAVGTTSWTDSAGRLWTLAGAAAITDREYRLHAEVSSWPPRSDLSGKDLYVPIEASGILRRLGQGQKALASTLARRLPGQGPVAYWPMEDGQGAVQAYSPIVGCAPLPVTGFTFAQDDTCPGSAPLPVIADGAIMAGPVPTYTSTASGWLVSLIYQLDAPASSLQPWLSFRTAGTAAGLVVRSTGTTIAIDGYDAAGTQIISEVFINPDTFGPGRWWRFDFSAQQNGGVVDYHVGWVEVDGTGSSYDWSTAGSIGNVVAFDTAFGPDFSGMKIGHLAVFPSSDLNVWGGSDNGFGSEFASDRLARLGSEESVPITATYAPTRMGPQRPATLLTLLAECEAADGGVLYEDRERLELRYRARRSFYTQPVALTLDYTSGRHVAPPLEPVDDDQNVRNDRTVNRIRGSAARAVLETGPLSIQAPPLGVGIYDDSVDLNLHTDSQVEQIAAWALHLGTWDEARYPSVHINLAAAPELIPAVLALDLGDRIQITNPPPWLPPGPIDLIVEGWSETLSPPSTWDIVLNCSPAGPWNVGVVGDAVYGKADTKGSVLGAAASSSATTLVVHTEQTAVAWSRPLWSQDPAQYPVALAVGGEVVTASAAAALASDDYGRTVAAGGWGTASDGLHTYTLTGGASSERSVGSGRGVVTVTSSQTTLRAQTLAETCEDCDIRVQVAVSATATGGSLAPCVLLRWVNSSSHYRARVEFTTGGTISLSASVGSTIIGSNAASGLSYTPGATFELRVRLIGHRILTRIWPTGTTEPILWHLDRTAVSGTITSGAIGLGTAGLTGNSNASVEYRFDNFLVESPQRITVTRSVNDITKSHAAGEQISLAQPAIAAL